MTSRGDQDEYNGRLDAFSAKTKTKRGSVAKYGTKSPLVPLFQRGRHASPFLKGRMRGILWGLRE